MQAALSKNQQEVADKKYGNNFSDDHSSDHRRLDDRSLDDQRCDNGLAQDLQAYDTDLRYGGSFHLRCYYVDQILTARVGG
ncbi:MAG: hypothetical protein ACRCTR_00840 [Actinomycetota bacterium]